MSTMTETRKLAPIARVGELADGTMKSFKVEGREVLLAMVAGKYYASENRCPHMGADLSQGKLEGTILTCPRHASKFDLLDGRVIRWTDWTGIKASVSKLFRSPRPLIMYAVKVEKDDILIEI